MSSTSHCADCLSNNLNPSLKKGTSPTRPGSLLNCILYTFRFFSFPHTLLCLLENRNKLEKNLPPGRTTNMTSHYSYFFSAFILIFSKTILFCFLINTKCTIQYYSEMFLFYSLYFSKLLNAPSNIFALSPLHQNEF